MRKKTAVTGMVALAMCLLATTAHAAPAVSITSPEAGATISRSATPQIPVAGDVAFDEPLQEERTLYMRRTQCASGSDDANLSVVQPGGNQQSSCAFIFQAANEALILAGDPGLSVTYPSENFAFTLDASRPITGTISLNGGFGQGTTEVKVSGLTATGQEVVLGTDTETYTVTGAATNVSWSVQPPTSEDKKDFASLSLNVRVRGVNALHGAIDHRNGASNLVIGVWNSSFTRSVQVAVDSGSFSSSGVTLSPDLHTYTKSIPTPLPGAHTIKVRAVQGASTSAVASAAITVTA